MSIFYIILKSEHESRDRAKTSNEGKRGGGLGGKKMFMKKETSIDLVLTKGLC